jgi:hypothetical protein
MYECLITKIKMLVQKRLGASEAGLVRAVEVH